MIQVSIQDYFQNCTVLRNKRVCPHRILKIESRWVVILSKVAMDGGTATVATKNY